MPTPIRPNVMLMVPYSPGKPIDEVKRELGLDSVIKLASNENPLGPSPKAVRALAQAAAELHIYPDGAAFGLRQAIAKKYDVDAASIILGNGSDELIHLLGLVFLGSTEDEVIVGDPSFVRYDASAELAACRLVRVSLKPDMTYDFEAMLAAVTPKTKLLFLANPNNPTGTMTTRTEVEALIAKLPEHVTLVLDEAYYEFAADNENYPNSIDYVKAGANVIGLRTFSKAFGLAGIRLGFGFASPSIVDAINRAREPFNVNSLAQAAGIAALDDDEHIKATVQNNRRGKADIIAALEGHGATVFASAANFVFADFGRATRPLFQALMEKGVIVRPGDIFGKPTCLRVSIGTAEENALFSNALAASCATR